MLQLVYTPKSRDDLDEIEEYISRDNAEIANKYVVSIIRNIDKLEQNPEIGISLERKLGIPTNYKFLICESHLAFYKIEGNFVRVYRVLHSKRDYISILGLSQS